MGRKKVQMKRIDDKSSRQVTVCKRRSGLMKKSRQLSIRSPSSYRPAVASSMNPAPAPTGFWCRLDLLRLVIMAPKIGLTGAVRRPLGQIDLPILSGEETHLARESNSSGWNPKITVSGLPCETKLLALGRPARPFHVPVRASSRRGIRFEEGSSSVFVQMRNRAVGLYFQPFGDFLDWDVLLNGTAEWHKKCQSIKFSLQVVFLRMASGHGCDCVADNSSYTDAVTAVAIGKEGGDNGDVAVVAAGCTSAKQ
ncbi:hypothetical protein RJ639_034400 [Escallonia herrerae]|uniref:MADS-box domain-containing protein n=1 Tax=Escallonia herrerae TaxID=1293975 RepID=A0AA88X749_9ASTE|nr:hypothetical protein RJ639_034400 [Escallonia herrerae]